MQSRNQIELLSPAGSLAHGVEAVKYGADAVYIGGPSFSARAAAANSLEDIKELIDYAHTYGARVYVALNTILSDKEVPRAQELAFKLYDGGADALIVQDYALLEAEMPPIPLHASTQMNNRTAEKVAFLQQCGFEQVVLARENSLETIRDIARRTDVRLESFVHGALCVCLSGQCYLSQQMTGRSANRGECAQPCRLPYNLVDADGKVLARNKHLLSIKDFSAESMLGQMIDAGVSAFKIEGRLKDINYVRNNTLYYRRRIDEILAERPHLRRASFGETITNINPAPSKSFNRGLTTLRLGGVREDIASLHTPKSIGEEIGSVVRTNGKVVSIKTKETISNGDGFCYVDTGGELRGFRAEKAENGNITVQTPLSIPKGTVLYRNYDKAFEDALERDRCERKLKVSVWCDDAEDGYVFSARADDIEVEVSMPLSAKKETAAQAEKALENIRVILSKSGGTPFAVCDVDVRFSMAYFIPSSLLTVLRRDLLNLLQEEIRRMHIIMCRETKMESYPAFPSEERKDYRANIHNSYARRFLERCGVKEVSGSYESAPVRGVELMRCHHCLRFVMGMCAKARRSGGVEVRYPLYLVSNRGARYELGFDCARCEMTLIG